MPIFYHWRTPPPHIVLAVRGVTDAGCWDDAIRQLGSDPRVGVGLPVVLDVRDAFIAQRLAEPLRVARACRALARRHPVAVVAPPGVPFLAARQVLHLAPEVGVVPTVEDVWAWLAQRG